MLERKLKTATAITAIVLAGHAFAVPTITGLSAQQRYPWNGLVDISCTVSGIDGDNVKWEFVVSTEDSGVYRYACHVQVVRDGTASEDLVAQSDGNYRLVWDARADLGEGIFSNVVVSVDMVKFHGKVQLWEGGPYWADTNIGAEKPEDYGLYFWWGDTVGYSRDGDAWVASDGSSQNFPFSSGNTPTYGKTPATLQSEGCVVSKDGTYVLAPEHDAAHVQWGGSWRMPTYQELYDLSYNKCDWIWTKMNGVRGYVVRGRGAYASASIFLPAAGYGYGTSLDYAGSYGIYWSSVPHESNSDYAWRLFFYSGYNGTGSYGRGHGQSVRPVQSFAE